MADSEQGKEPTQAQLEKERWQLKVTKAEYWYKVVIMIFGSLAASAFFVYQYRQTENRNFTDLMSSRETSDSQLRAEMFKTLFEAYFRSKVQPGGEGAKSAGGALDTLRQEVMLSDVLARNFENIDIRPVFEDLDRRLTAVIEAAPRDSSPEASREPILAFKQREELRRVAIGATARQVASLEALGGDAKARVTNHTVLHRCRRADKPFELSPELPPVIAANSGRMEIIDVKDGRVVMRVWPRKGVGAARPIGVSYYDMPALENISLENGERVAFSLNLFVSRESCDRFRGALDAQTADSCVDIDSDPEICAIARFRTVVLPQKFLGLHDRPYQNDLAAGRYRDPWWKVW